jgi:hypothetical protein
MLHRQFWLELKCKEPSLDFDHPTGVVDAADALERRPKDRIIGFVADQAAEVIASDGEGTQGPLALGQKFRESAGRFP